MKLTYRTVRPCWQLTMVCSMVNCTNRNVDTLCVILLIILFILCFILLLETCKEGQGQLEQGVNIFNLYCELNDLNAKKILSPVVTWIPSKVYHFLELANLLHGNRWPHHGADFRSLIVNGLYGWKNGFISLQYHMS